MKLSSRNLYWIKCGTNEAVTVVAQIKKFNFWKYEGWNFNSGNYLFTTDTK